MSIRFLARGLAQFQQIVDDAGSVEGKKQHLIVAHSAEDDSATVPLQHQQFQLPLDCHDDVEMFSMTAAPHDRDIMPKVWGVM